MGSFVMHPIGIIHTPFKEPSGTPIQFSRTTTVGGVEAFLDILEGLDGLEEFFHLVLIDIWHVAPKLEVSKVKPFLDDQEYGLEIECLRSL